MLTSDRRALSGSNNLPTSGSDHLQSDESTSLLHAEKSDASTTSVEKKTEEESKKEKKETPSLYTLYVTDLFKVFPHNHLPRVDYDEDSEEYKQHKDDHLYAILKTLRLDPVPVLRKQEEEEEEKEQKFLKLDEHYFAQDKSFVRKGKLLLVETGEVKAKTDDNPYEVSLEEFSKKYQLLLDYQARFEEICSFNKITDEKQKEALKLFFEKVQLAMMVLFLIMISKADGEKSQQNLLDEEVAKKIAASLVFALTSKAVLFSEAIEGYVGTTEVLPASDPYTAIVSLLVGTICAGFNYYMRLTTEIRPQQESVESHVLPHDAVYIAQMHVAHGINDVLLKKQSNFKNVSDYVEYTNFAKTINTDIQQRKKDFQVIPETFGRKAKRYFAALGAAGVRAPFVFFTVSEGLLGFLALLALFGVTSPPGWFFLAISVFAGVIALGVGIFVYRQMKKNFKIELNPDIAARNETIEKIAEYDQQNQNMPELVHKNIVQRVQEKIDALKYQIDFATTFIKKLEKGGATYIEETAEKIAEFRKQLQELEASCVSLDKTEFSGILSQFLVLHADIEKLEQLTNELRKSDAGRKVEKHEKRLAEQIAKDFKDLGQAIFSEYTTIAKFKASGQWAGPGYTTSITQRIDEFEERLTKLEASHEVLSKKNKNASEKSPEFIELQAKIQELRELNKALMDNDAAIQARLKEEREVEKRKVLEVERERDQALADVKKVQMAQVILSKAVQQTGSLLSTEGSPKHAEERIISSVSPASSSLLSDSSGDHGSSPKQSSHPKERQLHINPPKGSRQFRLLYKTPQTPQTAPASCAFEHSRSFSFGHHHSTTVK